MNFIILFYITTLEMIIYLSNNSNAMVISTMIRIKTTINYEKNVNNTMTSAHFIMCHIKNFATN